MNKSLQKIKQLFINKFKKVISKIKKIYKKIFSKEMEKIIPDINYSFDDFNVKERDKKSSIVHLIFAGKIDVNESSDKLKYVLPILHKADYTFCSIDKDINEIDYSKYYFDYYVNNQINTKSSNEVKSIIEFNNKKIGLYTFDADEISNRVIDKIIDFKKEVDYLICFYNYNKFMKTNVDKLFDIDIDYIIGIPQKESSRLQYYSKKKSYMIRTLGRLMGNKFINENFRDSMLLNLRLQIKDNVIKLIEDSYIPVYNGELVNSENNIPVPIKMQEYNLEVNDVLDNSRRRIGNKIVNLLEERRYFNIKDMFNILEIEIPDYCQNIQDERVRKICNSVGQTTENSVLFIRPYNGIFYNVTEEEYIAKIQESIYKAEERGTLVIFTPYHFTDKIPEIIVEDPLIYNFIILKHIINCLNLKIKVGVTGSVGKTTTKELIYNVLKYQYITKRSVHNSNTLRIGLYLQKLGPNVEAFVQELGGGKIGRVENNAKTLGLTSGVVTNVENAHLRWSGSREQLLINKTSIQKGIKNNGPLFINIDNDLLDTYKHNKGVVTYSLLNNKADYYAKKIVYTKKQSTFYVCRKNKKTKVTINLLGEHNVADAIAAFGIAEYEGVPVELIVKGLLDFKPSGIRQNIVKIANKTLYVDCFNANFASLKSSTEHLTQIGKDKRKILVFSDYTGLDDESEQAHIDSANFLAQSEYDIFVLYGEDVKVVRDILEKNNKKLFYSNNSDEICAYLKKTMKFNDYILFKGSGKFELEKSIIDEIFGTTMSYSRSLSKGINLKYEDELGQTFTLSEHFALIKQKNNIRLDNNVLFIPDEIKKLPLKSIEKKSFIKNINIEKFIAGNNLTIIKEEAFKDCVK